MNDELHNFVLDNCTPENVFPGPKGNVLDSPLWFRKKIYDCIKQIDFDEINEMLKNPEAEAIMCNEFKGLNIAIGKDKIVVFIRMKFYNTDTKETEKDKVFAFGIPRDELEDLIKEN